MATISHIEIAGTDGHRLKQFYEGLFGWEIRQRDAGGFDYFDIGVSGSPSAGIRHEPDGHAEIVVYLEVDHLDEVVATAKTLGASVRIPPMRHGNLRFALIQDPEGNPFGLTQHEKSDDGWDR
jgi:predicted enzyme related to lactoylglutathione lyase